jgi:tetratricopeptide (TPR) repeat protein
VTRSSNSLCVSRCVSLGVRVAVAVLLTVPALAQTQPDASPEVKKALHELELGQDVDANVAKLTKAVEQSQDPGAFAFQLGAVLVNDRRYESAQPFLEIARARKPDDATVAYALGRVHAQLHHYKEGFDQLSAAEKLMPAGLHPVLHQYLSAVLLGLQRSEEAEARARRAIDEGKAWNATAPAGQQVDLVDLDLNLANVHLECRQFEAALAIVGALDREAGTPRDKARAWKMRGRILDAKGDDPGAVAAFSEQQKLAPDDVEACYDFALFHVRRNRPEQARPLLEHVVALDPQHEGAHFNLARLLVRAGEKELGAKTMREYERIHAARIAGETKLSELRLELARKVGSK